MEVHHHPHTPRKKGIHYFWDFLMLFLAVFCGFLAEYQLEHKIERDKERQYIKNLVNDLKVDTMELSRLINDNSRKIPDLDSLALICFQEKHSNNDIKKMYNCFARSANSMFTMNFLDITISQLKNAGGMRLIRNDPVRDGLLKYDHEIQGVKITGENYRHYYFESITLSRKIFNMKYNRIPNLSGNLLSSDSFVQPKLVTNRTEVIIEYGNAVEKFKAITSFYISYLKTMQVMARDLILILKKEYHIE